MQLHINNSKNYYFLFNLVLFVILHLCEKGHLSGIVLSVALLLHNVLSCSQCMRNKNGELLIIYIFMTMFSLPSFLYYVYSQPITEVVGFYDANYPKYVYAVALQLYLFHIFLSYIIDYSKRPRKIQLDSLALFRLCILISLICIFSSGSGGNILTEGGYHNALQSGSRDSMMAYGIIFISIALVCATTRTRRIVVYFVSFVFVLKNLLMGGRIESISLLFALYCLRIQFRISIKKTLLFVFLGYAFVIFWGLVRNMGDLNVGLNADDLGNNGTANDVYYASMRVTFLVDRGILSMSDRIMSFAQFCLSTVIPYSKLSSLANLSAYLTSDYMAGGGGLISCFFYAWGGYLGIMLIAIFLAYSFNHSNNEKSSVYWRYYGILLVAMTPRWFSYYPIQIFKFCIYGVVIFYIFNAIKVTFLNKK